MFEKSRIHGAINYLLRCHQMGSLKAGAAERALAPLLSRYAAIMRERKMSSDQTAVLLISETVNGLHIGDVTVMWADQPELLKELAVLFVSVEHLSKARPEKFAPYFVEPEFLVSEYLREKAFNG